MSMPDTAVAYRKTLNGVLLNEDTFGRRTGVPDYLLISHELLAQMTTPNIMLTEDPLVLKDRLLVSVKTTHTVNIDKKSLSRERWWRCGGEHR